MRLFGRNANQGSTKRPDVLDVPPELRPYYREQAVSARTRYTAVRILTVVLIVGAVAALSSLFWASRHKIGSYIDNTIISMTTKQPAKSHSSSGAAKGSNQGTSIATNSPSNSQQDQPKPSSSPSPVSSSPAPTPTPASSSTDGSSGGNQPTPPAGPTTAAPPAHSSAIPNTGPGAIWLAAIVCSIGGTALYQLYIRRHRTDRL